MSDNIFKVDEEFFKKVLEAKKEMKEWRDSFKKEPPTIFKRGKFIVKFE